MGGNPLDTSNGVVQNLWPMTIDPAIDSGNPPNTETSTDNANSGLPPGSATTGFGAVFAANG